MVPPLDHFQGKNRNCSSLGRTISASRRSFFANLTTFERRSGLKKFSLLKIAILKMGWLSKFQSHRSWGDAHLSLGPAQAPPNQNGINLRLINFDNHPIFKIHDMVHWHLTYMTPTYQILDSFYAQIHSKSFRWRSQRLYGGVYSEFSVHLWSKASA